MSLSKRAFFLAGSLQISLMFAGGCSSVITVGRPYSSHVFKRFVRSSKIRYSGYELVHTLAWTTFLTLLQTTTKSPFGQSLTTILTRRLTLQKLSYMKLMRYLSAKLSACDAVRGNIFNINCFPLVAQQQAHE